MKIRTTIVSMIAGLTVLAGTAFAQIDISDVPQLEDGVFTVAMSGEYPPFSMPAEEGGLEGFDADVALALGDVLGVEVEIEQAQFSGIIGGVQAGRFDASIASHARTPAREQSVAFLSEPYYYGGGQFFAPADSEYDDWEEILDAGGTIAVDRGGTNQQWLEDNGYGDSVATYSGVPTSLQAIRAGQAQAIFTNPIVGNQAFRSSGMDMKPVSGLVFEENAWITVASGSDELKAVLEEALNTLRENGTLLEISEEWVGGDIVTPPSE
ncbi:MAG: transporter substrate-binding domain-containing protein [Trueperaceae bacterium]|nr:transporter substrate-binding domain-containing protein [Trueperaceae bacterium]